MILNAKENPKERNATKDNASNVLRTRNVKKERDVLEINVSKVDFLLNNFKSPCTIFISILLNDKRKLIYKFFHNQLKKRIAELIVQDYQVHPKAIFLGNIS